MKDSKKDLEKAIIVVGKSLGLEKPTKLLLKNIGTHSTIKELTYQMFVQGKEQYFEKNKDLRKVIKTTLVEYLSENLNIEYYEHGHCELFALALHKTLGYDMYFFIDNSAEYETEDGDYEYGFGLVHAYCKDDKGNYFDASGLTTLDDIENEHGDYYEPEHILVSEKMFYDYIKNGLISNFNISELNKLQTYIKQNVSKYTV